MQRNLDNVTAEKLIKIIQTSPIPLSTREVGTHLRQRHLRIPDYKISGILREMLRDGKVAFNKERWSIITNTGEFFPRLSVVAPSLSRETLSSIGWEMPRTPMVDTENGVKWTEQKIDQIEYEVPSGRWDTFRRLLAYYRQCVRNEEGSDASAFQNELGKRFVYLHKVGPWHPKPGQRWQSSIPLGPHLSPLLNSLPGPADDQALVVGYPVQAYYKVKQDEPDVAIIRPIFFFTVEYTVSREGLIVSCEDPRPEVNIGWLDYAFSRNPDRQRSFLSACGFINRWRPNDEAPGLERGEFSPSIDNLVSALTYFIPERIRQPMQLDCISDHPLHEPFKSGIYNRAVLMLAKRTKYTANLLKELAFIEKASEETLDRTALRYIFTHDEDLTTKESEKLLHESVVADTTQLNADQRRAIASLLTRNIAVITGPPGTGKSQVVSSSVANSRLRGQTVLFASRNHKAIDAVIDRLTDSENRSLIVRTNSKNDPNLNVTFVHALRDMLAEQYESAAAEGLARVREELISLMDERGRTASDAHQVAEAGNILGELEERMSYLAESLPDEMTLFLDVHPERFPDKTFRRIAQVSRKMSLNSSGRTLPGRIIDLVKAISLLPWQKAFRHKLRCVPGAPELPAWTTPKTLNSMLSNLPLLERAMEYAQFRIRCHPYEAKISKLPPLAETTKSVAELSKRIYEVATRAVSLDLDSRRGLPPGANREALDGLRAALKAMRTGLDEGVIRAETLRVLSEQIPYILQAFPCWAVTNLSAGSRIPLVAGIFDLSIVDEASQSDIPSAIPILFRAKRAGVVGDPFQLTHTSKISTAKDTILRRQVGLKRVEDVRFAYTENSLYNLFAGTRTAKPILLSETYRSATEIANYSNYNFYNGRLRVATDHNKLSAPYGTSLGIHWTEVVGEVQSGGGSGCYCQKEVDEVLKIIRVMLLDNNFLGTVGIVTPFRQQANRLRDALFESETKLYEALLRSQAHVDTAHGFQGDERDVIVFSLCAGPDMPTGSRSFLRETGNLFNVAVSRTRAVLHMVGNRDWARRCGIKHVERLVVARDKTTTTQFRGPWHPHESPWEEILFKALVKAGIQPRPQFPVSSRRLDMALVRQGDRSLKIDIEVDGDCHRNPDGTRKIDDLWRDIQIQALGWKVMRFWTYQLRENLAGCVDKIIKVWSEHE